MLREYRAGRLPWWRWGVVGGYREGVWYDFQGQEWKRVCEWMPGRDVQWVRVLQRGPWLEPVREMERQWQARGRVVPVVGILGGYGLKEISSGRWQGRWVRRREFPARPGKRGGVYGWRAQLVALYVLARWPELTGWDALRARDAVDWPGLGLIRGEMERIVKGGQAWTVRTERRVVAALARVERVKARYRAWKHGRSEDRLARRKAKAHSALMRVGLLGGGIRIG